ncbi:hypothetical protein RB620_24735 [Paenibacillus sp. LHD-117]|uniref:hypothetical protein n=1 Tax=Paenibacillus sp. LHD-117 TaxID=3071412 RepID=UPI0027DECFA5|nr:hypothetical protein [Paenibacillus sp. LHD-117]MDQ6422644.1 hypothetical protein [Paenibacillus sp. LHD-117]
MDAMLLYFMYVVLVLLLTLPIIRRISPETFHFFYYWAEEYKALKGERRRTLKFVSQKADVVVSKGVIRRFERLIRLAGYPMGLSARELIFIYIVVAIAGIYASTQVVDKTKVPVLILSFLIPAWHIVTLRKKKNERQLYATESIRFLKRRFIYLLKNQVGIIQALDNIADLAPGEFGETFRRYMNQVTTNENKRSLRDVMADFRQEYEVSTLNSFCMAIELSELKSPGMLADQIFRQTLKENASLEEFVEKKLHVTKGKMIGLVAVAAVWTLILSVWFSVVAFFDYFSGAGGFLFFK